MSLTRDFLTSCRRFLRVEIRRNQAQHDSERPVPLRCDASSLSEVTMADRVEWMIYGANGYTGHLVAVEARRQGLHPVLAGRRSGPIETLAAELSLPARVFNLGDAQSAGAALADMAGRGAVCRRASP